MELFKNLIYEYKKGMRDLALYTCEVEQIEKYKAILNLTKTPFTIQKLPQNKCNIFLGNQKCLEILNTFSSKNLDKITPQEDFILGIMLGYSRNEQYTRLLSKTKPSVTFCKNS